MFNPTKVTTDLSGLVGYRQPFNPDFSIVDANNLLSSSGYFVNDNPFAKIEYLKDTQDYSGISDVDFNTFLSQLIDTSIVDVCNSVFNEADYIDKNLLFINAQNRIDTVALPNGFVGFQIRVSNEKNIAFEITRILLDFKTTGTFKLLLFNTSFTTPIFEKEITITTDHQEEVLNFRVDNSDTTYKGEYYLGYLTDGLTITPFEREFESADIQSQFTHLSLRRIFVPGHNTETMFDLDDEESLESSIGLNPDIMVFDDFTDLIKQNKQLFSRAIQLKAQINALTNYLASLRSNKNERKTDELIVRITQEIEGQNQEGLLRISGLRPMLFGEIASIRKQIAKLREGYGNVRMTVDTMT
ncbi:hypothetical protein LCGC14_0370740 [marine sediment metagenome]|uniref:Uncharacterized protein n=1 Tax=marine sediment metagenome TaxID=412755 RepID=A0A0F9WDT4_9ZZZZ|nr:hypothetical protein [Maribacter sp.]HDZ04837.1 hypothetical protein [Maribacter sp.]